MAREKVYLFDHSPHLRGEWDFGKNTLNPYVLTYGSQKSAWWVCAHAHSWASIVKSRTGLGNGCPYCRGLIPVTGVSDLLTTHPELSKEMIDTVHSADTLSAGSNKKVQWRCSSGHEWKASVLNRARGAGCPTCSGRIRSSGVNDIGTLYPDISLELVDPSLSTELGPFSNKYVEWTCQEGHQYTARVADRVKGQKCSVCTNRVIILGVNDLLSTHPDIASELVEPQQGATVVAGSGVRLKWRCPHGHQWETSPSSRTGPKKSGCPFCFRTSNANRTERYLKEALEGKFADSVCSSETKLDINWRSRTYMHVDFLLSSESFRLVVEYDGEYWHKDKLEIDADKTSALLSKGYRVVRIREDELVHLKVEDRNLLQLSVPYSTETANLTNAINLIYEWMQN